MNLAQTKTDFKRILETNLNLDKPRAPAFLTFNEVYRGFQTADMDAVGIITSTRNLEKDRYSPLYNPDEKARSHQTNDLYRCRTLRDFLQRQYQIDDTRNHYKKIKFKYGRTEYMNGQDLANKSNGQQLAKVIRDANNPPDQVEQDRRQLDYTLRACEYIQRIENRRTDAMIKKLEPRLLEIAKNFSEGDWTQIYWHKLGINDALSKLDYLFYLHRTHASIKSPLQIAYYPTLRHLRDRREVITKLGKYLTTFKDFLQLSESDIKAIVEKHNAIIASQSGWTLNFIESNDADGFERVYNNCTANSCMKGESAVRVYAHEKSVIRLAYLTNGANEIIARSIVREDRKQYIRTYPETNGTNEGRHLADILKANGYTHGNLEGCLLKAIPYEDDEDIYVAPYIDGGIDGNGNSASAQYGSLVEIDGKNYIEIGTEGELNLTNTNGYTDNIEDDEDYSDCDDCGERTHHDDMYSTYHDRYVCEDCSNENYTYAYVRNGQDYVENEYVVEVNNEYYHEDYLDRYDIYLCEVSNEHYHIDDLVMTSIGLIHVDYAKPLDHPDQDGNDYAHEDDARELSDGTYCHKDDEDELQDEIDGEDDDEDDEETTQNESGYYFGKNLTPEQKQHNSNLLDQAEKDILKNENN